MNHSIDPETLKIPAFLRKKAIVSQARQKLILTALDRKEAGLSPKSKKALAPVKNNSSRLSRRSQNVRSQLPTPQKIKEPQNTTLSHFLADLSSKKISTVGTTTHYLDNIQVAIIKLTTSLKVGESIVIEGEGYLFIQPITEMQIDRKPVEKAKKGSHIGLKVNHAAKVKGSIYKFFF